MLKRLNTGNKASNFFQQANRWSVCGSVSPGPLRTWRNKDFMKSLMGCLLLKSPKVDKSVLRTGLDLENTFAVNSNLMSQKLYEKHNAKTVLDFSRLGYRLCGFFASDCTENIGLDPVKKIIRYTINKRIYERHRTFKVDNHMTLFAHLLKMQIYHI